MKKRLMLAATLIGAGAAVAWAQRGDGPATPPTAKAPFEARLWRYLSSGPAAYDEWGPFPGQPVELRKGQSPHGAFVRVLANKKARTNPANPPHGSILIKENYAPDGTTLGAVTVMYRSAGYDPDHGDWYWVKYLPDGTVDRTPPEKGSRPIMGRFASCIDCHAGAGGDDLVYVNDDE